MAYVNVMVDKCEYGLPQCPHCTGTSMTDCDEAAENRDCSPQEVSQ